MRRHRHYSTRLLLLFSGALSACDGAAPGAACLGQTRHPVLLTDEHAVLENRAEHYLLRLDYQDVDSGAEEYEPMCTATRIARGVALTAQHCLRDSTLEGAIVQPFPHRESEPATRIDDCGSPNSTWYPVERLLEHSELDLALLFYFEPEGAPIMPVTSRPPDADLFLSGFGLTETGTRGELRTIAADFVEYALPEIIVQGVGGGACLGDSGGPLYSEVDDAFELHGVLSRGSISCEGRDHYVDLALTENWLAEHVSADETN